MKRLPVRVAGVFLVAFVALTFAHFAFSTTLFETDAYYHLRMSLRYRDEGPLGVGAEMPEAAGCADVKTYNNDTPPGLTIHEMGTARMGKSPKDSVLNKWNQVWDAPNVFVTDGASMASSGCQNPSVTYMALTARAVDHAVGALNRKEL